MDEETLAVPDAVATALPLGDSVGDAVAISEAVIDSLDVPETELDTERLALSDALNVSELLMLVDAVAGTELLPVDGNDPDEVADTLAETISDGVPERLRLTDAEDEADADIVAERLTLTDAEDEADADADAVSLVEGDADCDADCDVLAVSLRVAYKLADELAEWLGLLLFVAEGVDWAVALPVSDSDGDADDEADGHTENVLLKLMVMIPEVAREALAVVVCVTLPLAEVDEVTLELNIELLLWLVDTLSGALELALVCRLVLALALASDDTDSDAETTDTQGDTEKDSTRDGAVVCESMGAALGVTGALPVLARLLDAVVDGVSESDGERESATGGGTLDTASDGGNDEFVQLLRSTKVDAKTASGDAKAVPRSAAMIAALQLPSTGPHTIAICSTDATVVPALRAAAHDVQLTAAVGASARTRRVTGSVLAGDESEKSRLLKEDTPAAVVVFVLATRIRTCAPVTPAAPAMAPRSAADTPAKLDSSC